LLSQNHDAKIGYVIKTSHQDLEDFVTRFFNEMEYSDSLLMTVLMVVLYLTVLCESSLEYRSYLKSSNPLEARQKARYICIFSGLAFVSPLIVVFVLFLSTALPSLPLIILGAIVLLVMFLSIYVVR